MNRLKSLAINDEGFVFDPSTGQSFNVNETGLKILRACVSDQKMEDLIGEFARDYSLSKEEAERDILDFLDHLRIYKLM